MYCYNDYLKAAEYINSRIGAHRPEIMVVLGSGLGGVADIVEDAAVIPYGDIHGFARSTAPDHAGRLVVGRLAGKCVMVMQGRFHYYEGYEPEQVVFPINVAHVMGIKKLILTNAAGAINIGYSVGDIMLIRDHIKLCAPTPFRGVNIPELGPRFFDMTYTYSPRLRDSARKNASELGIRLQEGVYFYFTGPQFETPAEIKAARLLGGDAAGMSTVYEAIAASHCGMEVLGLSLMTNMAAGVLPEKLSGSDVVETANRMKKPFSELVMACIADMGDE